MSFDQHSPQLLPLTPPDKPSLPSPLTSHPFSLLCWTTLIPAPHLFLAEGPYKIYQEPPLKNKITHSLPSPEAIDCHWFLSYGVGVCEPHPPPMLECSLVDLG